MTEVAEIVEVDRPLEEAGIAADVVLGSSTAHVFLEDPATLERAEQRLRSIENIEVYRRDAIPEALHLRHPTRNGDLVLVTGPPRVFHRPTAASRLLIGVGGMLGLKRGGHGYDPAHPDMGAIFFALGRGVVPGSRPAEVRAIDVAPTVARLLGIEPPRHAEGEPIAGIGLAPAP
jgi:predicted AlkP superfamily pyrophosphatase or phosphodiesterase